MCSCLGNLVGDLTPAISEEGALIVIGDDGDDDIGLNKGQTRRKRRLERPSFGTSRKLHLLKKRHSGLQWRIRWFSGMEQPQKLSFGKMFFVNTQI